MKKNNKKKLLAVFLFLFALAGVIGYGAYSYYYTTGTAESSEQSIDLAAFSPEFYGDHFIHSVTGEIHLSCPSSSSGAETVECTGSLDVINGGDTDITVEVSSYNVSSEPYNASGVQTSEGTPSFSWNNSTISPGSTGTLYITVPVSISNGTSHGSGGSEAEFVEYAVSGGEVRVSISVNLTATQVH